MIFIKCSGIVYIVKVPEDQKHRSYFYARELLKVPEGEITMWCEATFNDKGVAKFDF